MQDTLAKKIFAVGSAVAMTLSLVAPFAAKAAAHGAGTNVISGNEVWMITKNGTRRAYTSAGAFLSYGFNSWSTVAQANADDLALPVDSAGYIPPQDGKVFCATETKGTDVKGECSLVTGGMKAAFTSASVFSGLGFSFSRAQSGDSSFLSKSADINNTTAAHRQGVLVHFMVNGHDTVFLVGPSSLLGIPDMATFNSWGYSFADVVPANAADQAMTQSGVMAMRTPGDLSPTALANVPNNPNVISGSVSASLAGDTPAANTIAVRSTGAKSVVTLAKFMFTGSGTVTQMQVKRIGVSPDTILSNVYLFEGDTRLTDAASVGGSSLVTFSNPNGLFTVSGSKTVSVVAEIPAGTSAGQTVGVQLTSYTVANGSPASVSVSGNMMTTAQVTDLAYPTFGTVTPGETTSQTRDAAKDTEVFRSSVTVNNRDMTLSRFIIRNIGSAQQADMNNFRLRIDGTQVAQAQSMDANGYIYFSFSPVTLKAGTRVFNVLADIVAGSSRTFQFQIRNASDVNFVDSQYNQAVSSDTTFPIGSTYTVTIQSGNLTIQKATDSPSGNITDGSSDVTLAKYTVTAYGEAMKIETLKAGFSSSDLSVNSLRNGRILVNGVQYGSTASLVTASTTGTSYTLNYTVQPGTPITVEIHADMYDNDGTNDLGNNDTVTATLMTGSNNVQRLVSLGYDSVPSTAIAGNAITDVTGSVTFSKNNTYAAQTTPLPQTNYKLASFNLAGSSSEDVNINSIAVGGVASTTLTALYNVKVLVNGQMFGTQKGSIAIGSSVISTSTFSSNYTLPKNTTVSVEVYGDINAPTVDYGSDSVTPHVIISGTSVSSSATITAGAVGQQISAGTSSVAAALDPSTPVAAIVAGNQTKTAAAYKFTSTNDQYTISEVTLYIANNTTVQNVILKDGSTVLATLPGSATTTFSNLNFVVPSNTTKILTVDLQLGNVGIGAGSTGENVAVALQNYKKAPTSSGSISTTYSGISGNAMYVYKAVPTITNVALGSSTLSAGTNSLYKFAISSGGTGTIAWTKLMFTIATSSGVHVTSPTLWDADTNTQLTGAASTTYAGGNLTFEFNATTEQQVSGSKNYVVKATVAISGTGAKTVSTSILQPTSHAVPASSVTATATPASFVWSDLAGSSNTAHSMTTSDWNNDNLVKNLPTDSQGLSASY